MKKMGKVLATLAILGTAAITLTACSGKKQGGSGNAANDAKNSAALITGNLGVNDNSFNQSAWVGLKAYSKEHGLKQGKNGYQYFLSNSDADLTPNIEQAAKAGYHTIFGVGFEMKDAISAAAKKFPKTNFAIIDDIVKGQKNVVSANFKSEDSSYLAGVAAAATTKTNVVGFIGGVRGDIIDLFEAGYLKGIKDESKKLGKKVKVLIQYVGSFSAADKAKSIAKSMYADNADVIYHAAGGAGNGLFSEAKALNQTKPANQKVWVIGVDVDQSGYGNYTAKDGKKANFVLTSDITGVNVAVKDIADQGYKGKFPSGKNLIYGLKNNGVALLKGQLSNKAWADVRAARQQVLAGKVVVPIHPAN